MASPRKTAGAPARGGAEKVFHGLGELERRNATLTRMLFMAMFVIVALAIALAVSLGTRPKPVYFAATPQLRIMRLIPMDRPPMSPAGIRNWVAATVTESLSLDFSHWRQTVARIQPRFTQSAFTSLLKSMHENGILKTVIKSRLVMDASVSKAPLLLNHWVFKGVAYWRYQFPLNLSYENSGGVVNTQSLVATVVVRRVPVTVYPVGLRVAQVVIQTAGG